MNTKFEVDNELQVIQDAVATITDRINESEAQWLKQQIELDNEIAQLKAENESIYGLLDQVNKYYRWTFDNRQTITTQWGNNLDSTMAEIKNRLDIRSAEKRKEKRRLERLSRK